MVCRVRACLTCDPVLTGLCFRPTSTHRRRAQTTTCCALCAAGLEPRLVQSYAWNSVWERLASQDKYRLRHIQNDRD
jgi:hypothetical protein